MLEKPLILNFYVESSDSRILLKKFNEGEFDNWEGFRDMFDED